MNHPERSSGINPDEAMERLWGGLRDIEPPQGMEGRILGALESHSAVPRRIFDAPRSWAFASACFAAVAFAVVWVATHHARHAATITIAATPHPASTVQVAQKMSPPSVHSTQTKENKLTTRVRLAPDSSQPVAQPPEEDSALGNLHAPSQPAPPMPLTEQEKLLLQLVHRGETVEVAMLDAKFRSEETSSRADFDRFFGSSNPPFIKPPNPDTPATGEKK